MCKDDGLGIISVVLSVKLELTQFTFSLQMSGEKAPPTAPATSDPPDFEQRFQCFLKAFLVSQETQAAAHQQQTEDFT